MPLLRLAYGTGNYLWSFIVDISRRAVLSVLSRVTIGQLVIIDTSTGVTTVCGALAPPRRPSEDDLKGSKAQSDETVSNDAPLAEIRVFGDAFWVRMLLFADMGFAESFMLGEVSCEDLTSFFEIFIRNRTALSNGTTVFSSVATFVSAVARKTNTLANARLHISAHYDISNAMFSAFLSPDMTYSCALFSPRSSAKAAKETLEEAQTAKLQLFIDGARLRRSDHVLEIGTGWGSLAIAAVRQTGCHVTTLTLSREQKALAEERIAEAGLTAKIDVLLCDYRALPSPPQGHYDKIISIEMLEAVGAEFLETYFECVDRLLKPIGGIAMFQCITIPEARYEAYAKGNDFIRQYIFPGGHLPTISQLISNINSGSQGKLIVDGVRNIGSHYAKTLRLWNDKFQRNFEQQVRPALVQEHPEMKQEDIELFRRKWQYYFTYCEAGFRRRILGDHIITTVREGATEIAKDVPL